MLLHISNLLEINTATYLGMQKLQNTLRTLTRLVMG